MSSLFNISANLQQIYDCIEENDGELTPELEEELVINEEELSNKLDDYCNLIKKLKGDVETVKLEQKRIADYRKNKEKLIEKLSAVVSEAVANFGNTTKSGGHNYDTGMNRIVVRNNSRCDISETGLEMLATAMNTFIHGMQESGTLGNVEFKDDFLKSQKGSELSNGDLKATQFKITFVGSCEDLTDGKYNHILKLLPSVMNGVITYDSSKTLCTNVLENGDALTIANIVPTKSLTIK